MLLVAHKAHFAATHKRQVRVLWRVCTVAWLLPDPTHLAQLPRTTHLPAAGAPTILFASILACRCADCCAGLHVLILVLLTS